MAINEKKTIFNINVRLGVLKKYLTIPFYYFMAITAFSFFVPFAIPQESVGDTVRRPVVVSSCSSSTSPPSSTSRTVVRERHRESQSVYLLVS